MILFIRHQELYCFFFFASTIRKIIFSSLDRMQKLFLFLLSFALIVPALSASEYEITFPILLSTDSIVSNDGSVTTEPYKPVLFDSILQFASLDPEISYVCMNTKQDHQVFTDILQMLSYQRPGPMIDR